MMTNKETPDPKYNNISVSKFTGQILKKGKKFKAQKIVYQCFEIIKEKTRKDPIDIFDEAVRNVAPSLEVKAKRVGGANYQVPVPVIGERRLTLAFRWIIQGAKSKKGKNMASALALEIIDAAKKQGSAIRTRDNIHKMAEANKAFAHFAR
ncbi:MAG: 30S ribosomal protein S7 [Candidatus Moranbacteria bacterium]|nr:30S ribosomal protein S7 [Candidatus Moranbacteria bacterium]